MSTLRGQTALSAKHKGYISCARPHCDCTRLPGVTDGPCRRNNLSSFPFFFRFFHFFHFLHLSLSFSEKRGYSVCMDDLYKFYLICIKQMFFCDSDGHETRPK